MFVTGPTPGTCCCDCSQVVRVDLGYLACYSHVGSERPCLKGYLSIVTGAGIVDPWGEAAADANFVIPFPSSPCTQLPTWVTAANTWQHPISLIPSRDTHPHKVYIHNKFRFGWLGPQILGLAIRMQWVYPCHAWLLLVWSCCRFPRSVHTRPWFFSLEISVFPQVLRDYLHLLRPHRPSG